MKAVLFDLDGTIINSEEGITRCVQYALRSFGIEEPDRKKLLCFIGPPLDPVFRERYGMSYEDSWKAVETYRERFDKVGIFECELYDGVKEAVRSLKEQGYLLAVASSKPEAACIRIVNHFGLDRYFDFVGGATLDGSVSTKTEVLHHLRRRMPNVKLEEMCLIGDTKYDVIGAKEFGIPCIGVSYGFGTLKELKAAGAAEVFDDIREVVKYIEDDKGL